MRQLITSAFVLLYLMSACKDAIQSEEGSKAGVMNADRTDHSTLINREIKKAVYTIGDSINETNLSRFKYFGTFFKGRAHYFHNHIDSVNNGTHKGFDLLLAYFDSQLARVKYRLETDISNELIRKYGSCKIRALDSVATSIVKARNILISNEGQVRLNADLKNYQMTWSKNGKEIVFTSRERDDNTPLFTYEERISDYKDAMIYLTRY